MTRHTISVSGLDLRPAAERARRIARPADEPARPRFDVVELGLLTLLFTGMIGVLCFLAHVGIFLMRLVLCFG